MFNGAFNNVLKVQPWRPGRPVLMVLLVLLLAAVLLGCGGAPTGEQGQAPAAAEILDTYVIADSTGDWGFPSPFGHYQRGPGYIRMSLLFDTLV